MDRNSDRLTYKDAVAYCGLKSEFALRRAVRRRELQQMRVSYRIILFEREELDRWMASKKSKVLKCNTSPPQSSSKAALSAYRSPLAGLAESHTKPYELDES